MRRKQRAGGTLENNRARASRNYVQRHPNHDSDDAEPQSSFRRALRPPSPCDPSCPPASQLHHHPLPLLHRNLSALRHYILGQQYASEECVPFADSLFLTISAMTLAGLNTVNLSELNTFQQVLLFLLIMLGSAIWVSAFVVHVRWKAFTRRMAAVKEERRRKRLERRSTSRVWRAMSWGTRRGADEEVGHQNEKAVEDEEKNGETTAERDLTPPGRRGTSNLGGHPVLSQ